MQQEIELFSIDGSIGGNQDWMEDPWMKLGACAALAAVDSCLFLSLHHGIENICPLDCKNLSIKAYNRFAEIMRPYLSPRRQGVNRLSIYTDGFAAYLRDSGCNQICMDVLPMGVSSENARQAVIGQIDQNLLVPMLHLTPKVSEANYYKWHWFLVTGYRESDDVFEVKTVTYDTERWVPLELLWNESDADNGGLILYRFDTPEAEQKIIKVSAAIICDRLPLPTRVFATARGYGAQKGGWEFPGGKLEPGESPEAALKREILEELDVSIDIGRLLTIIEYDYPTFHLSMNCYTAMILDGKPPVLKEALDARWITKEELHSVNWLPADSLLPNIIEAEMTNAEEIAAQIAAEEQTESLRLLDA